MNPDPTQPDSQADASGHDLRIPAWTRSQAMDWSLVLASQGIEPVIEGGRPDGAWSLRIPPSQRGTALTAIRAYESENRRVESSPIEATAVPVTALVGWAAFTAAMFSLSARPDAPLRILGQVDSEALGQGQWWRLITATFLHADIAHLASNLTTGLFLLGAAMTRYGAAACLWLTLLAGALGNVLTYAFHSFPYHGLGASGSVLGALGLLVADAVHAHRRGAGPSRSIRRSIAAGTLLFVLLGTHTGSDVTAHLGGFLGGFALGGAWLTATHGRPRRPTAAVAAAAGWIIAVLAAWHLALR